MTLNSQQPEIISQVIETAWLYSPERFLQSVLARTGQSFEGVVSFAYHWEYPEELPEGVSLSYLGEEIVLEEATFERCVLDYARQHEARLDCLKLKPLIDALGKRT